MESRSRSNADNPAGFGDESMPQFGPDDAGSPGSFATPPAGGNLAGEEAGALAPDRRARQEGERGKIDTSTFETYRLLLRDSSAPTAKLMVQTGLVEEDIPEFLEQLARRNGLEYRRIRTRKLPAEVVETLDKEIATKYTCVPIELHHNQLTVALADPWDLQAQDDLRNILRDYELNLVLGDEREIRAILHQHFTGDQGELGAAFDETLDVIDKQGFGEKDAPAAVLDDSLEEDADSPDATPIVRLVSRTLEDALRSRASDIHFECYQHDFKVRFRIDGVLQDRNQPAKHLQNAIISRLKLMSGMDLAEKRIPQDGRIQTMLDGKHIDFRVSALPSIYGESVVLRLLDKSGLLLGLDQVGFLPDTLERFNRIITRPNGIVLITGPTGSGKTTTLYSALNTINNVDTKIITVENPVEYQLEGINQVQVNEEIGLDFSAALRTILRQSPNVVLIGEIRDRETAEIAIRAALTGHLVFSTLHTNDASGAPTRLIEMGIKPFLVASSLQAVLAQRLVRRICDDCKEAYTPDDDEVVALGLDPEDNPDIQVYQGRGCATCNYTGYRGRTSIVEMMEITEEVKDMILERAPSEHLRRLVREQGMRTLREDGWQKVLRGDTSIVEVARVTQSDKE